MLETYKVGVTLELGGNVQPGVDRLIAQMEKLDRAVNDSGSSFRKLAEDISTIGTAGRSIASLVRALEGARTGGAVGNFDSMATSARALTDASERLTAVLRENAQLSANMARSAEAAARATGRGDSPPGGGAGGGAAGGSSQARGGSSSHDWMMAGMGASMIGEPLIRGGETAFDRAVEVAHLRTQILADSRVSEAQADAMVKRAYEATASAPGTRVGQNLHALIDLKQVTGDLKEADALLPRFAQLSALLAVMDRRKGGSGDSAFAAAKAMELMGGMVEERQVNGQTVREINPELMQRRLDMIARVAVATNARVEPNDYLAFAKQARVAGMTLSDEFIYERLPAIMLGMGGSRAGTAFMSMAQVFEGGKLTVKSMEALQDIGLAGPDGIEMRGKEPVVHPEAIYDLALMRSDPDKWVNAASGRMDAAGIHGTDNQIVALMKASQRTTIAGALADLLKDRPVIEKEQANIRATRPDVASFMAQQDPAAKVQQMQAAFDKLMTAFGSAAMGDAIALMDRVTAGLNAMAGWAQRNPTMARLLTDTAVGLGGIATALGTLSTALFLFGPALKLLRGGGAGPIAPTGLAGPSGVAGGLGAMKFLSPLLLGLDVWDKAHNLKLDDFHGKQRELLEQAPLSTDNPDPATRARRYEEERRRGKEEMHNRLFRPDSYLLPAPTPPPVNMNVNLTGSVNVDGRKLGEITAKGLTEGHPGTGPTGFDPLSSAFGVAP